MTKASKEWGSLAGRAEMGVQRQLKQNLLEVNFIFQGVSLSIFDAEPSEIVHLTLQDVTISFFDTGEDKITEGAIGRVQVDNQLLGGVEVILQPTPLPPEAAGSGQPFLQMVFVRHNHIGAAHYRHFEVLVQVISLQVLRTHCI